MSLNVRGLATKGILESHPRSARKHDGWTAWKICAYHDYSFVHSGHTIMHLLSDSFMQGIIILNKEGKNEEEDNSLRKGDKNRGKYSEFIHETLVF